ncbi:hypothetical protein FD35_GL002660 [Furfurilactobacillus rossiae DSM 15814]|jgi:hypothetical protein|uniref:Uncharacterized protein n=1 Tax=Furfurilactobacillus rossiae DSM 15814 TaxID=1114972 RepID=A0A0R1RJ35_9LACO|nr:hypothetical protein FD35_GL002660 [Furfurilactobacillus rossiae DSM 15814]
MKGAVAEAGRLTIALAGMLMNNQQTVVMKNSSRGAYDIQKRNEFIFGTLLRTHLCK